VVLRPRRVDVAKATYAAGREASRISMKAVGNFRSLGPNLDTLLIGGGWATWELPKNEELLGWLRQISAKVRRVAAVGSGAFFVGRRVAAGQTRNHPLALGRPLAAQLSKHPCRSSSCVRSGRQILYVGVSVSIDLSLAMASKILETIVFSWPTATNAASETRGDPIEINMLEDRGLKAIDQIHTMHEIPV
jgi:hypothetical protein